MNAPSRLEFHRGSTEAESRLLRAIREQVSEHRTTLLMLVFLISGGFIFLMAFGKAFIKFATAELFSGAALQIIHNRGWDRAFNALH